MCSITAVICCAVGHVLVLSVRVCMGYTLATSVCWNNITCYLFLLQLMVLEEVMLPKERVRVCVVGHVTWPSDHVTLLPSLVVLIDTEDFESGFQELESNIGQGSV